MINAIHASLKITICESVEDAVAQGFVYKEPDYLPIEIIDIVVVKNGTKAGNSTADFILKDSTGQKFCFMVTSRLLKSIPAFE